MPGLGALTPEQQTIAMQGMASLTTGAAFAFASQAKLKQKKVTWLGLEVFLDKFQEKPRLLISIVNGDHDTYLVVYYE